MNDQSVWVKTAPSRERSTLPGRPVAGRPTRPPRLRRTKWSILGLAIAVASGMAAYQLLLRPIEVIVAAARTDVPIEVYALGSVEGRVVSKIGFDVAGTVRELDADEGDRVAPGAVLARLDSRQQEARVALAEASVAQASAALDQARAAVVKADVLLAQARRTSARRQDLVRSHIVSDQAAEEARTAVESAAADQLQAASGVQVAAANLAQAQANLLREQTALAQHTLAAPFAAIVVSRHLELGAPAKAADPVFDLVDPRTVWVRAYVDEASAGGIRVGQPAEIRLRALPAARFHGSVARVGIENDRVGEERRVEISCQDCPGDFHLGEQAEAVITTMRLAEALLVPQRAFEAADARGGFVWTVENGRLQHRHVTFGHRTLDGLIEISAGSLPAAAQVVAERASGMRIGRRASIGGGS